MEAKYSKRVVNLRESEYGRINLMDDMVSAGNGGPGKSQGHGLPGLFHALST